MVLAEIIENYIINCPINQNNFWLISKRLPSISEC